MHNFITPDAERSLSIVAKKVHFETIFPEYENALPQIKNLLPSLTEGDIGKTFVLAEAVQAERGYAISRSTLRLVPLPERTSPWEVALESIMYAGDNPSGAIFMDRRRGNLLIVGPEDLSQGYGIIRRDEIFDENDDYSEEFLTIQQRRRKELVLPLFRSDKEVNYRVTAAIGNHLALLAGNVVIGILGEGFYPKAALKNAIVEIGRDFIAPSMSDIEYREYMKGKQDKLKDINSELEVGSFVLVEGKHGFHIYEVVDGDKSIVNPKKRKPDNHIALKEYGLIPNYNSHGQTLCESLHASNVNFIKNNALKGIVFFDKDALLEYLPISNTNLRHVPFQQALSCFCGTLLNLQ